MNKTTFARYIAERLILVLFTLLFIIALIVLITTTTEKDSWTQNSASMIGGSGLYLFVFAAIDRLPTRP